MTKEKGTPAPIVEKKMVRSVVIAVSGFTDALTGKSFWPGDEVTGWNHDRVAEYSRRGLVYETAQVEPSEVK